MSVDAARPSRPPAYRDHKLVLAIAALLAVSWLVYVGVRGVDADEQSDRRVDQLVERQRILVELARDQQQLIDRQQRRLKVLRDQLEAAREGAPR